MGNRRIGWFGIAATTALAIAGCNAPKLTRTGPAQPPKSKDCQFELLTTLPNGKFAEIGVIDIANTFGPTTDIGRFKESIAPKVCEAGGDVAIAYANGVGVWIKATVLKKMGPDDASQDSEKNAHKNEDSGGCKFDTQCKGDRVCVKGECVAPPAAPAPSASSAPVSDSH